MREDPTRKYSERNFANPSDVRTIATNLVEADSPRSERRARVQSFFSGAAPYLDEEAEEFDVSVNCNDLFGTQLLQYAQQRVAAGFMDDKDFVTITLKDPIPNSEEIGLKLTDCYEKLLRGRKEFTGQLEDRWRSVVLHGWGAMVFIDPLDYLPTFVQCDDVKWPSRTLADLSNASLFVVKRRYSMRELHDDVLRNEDADEGWNKGALKRMMTHEFDRALTTWNDMAVDSVWQADSWEQDMDTDAGRMRADVLPSVDLYHVYYFDPKPGGWMHRAVAANYSELDKFVYEGKQPLTDDIAKLVHLQIADTGIMVPRRVHSIRGLAKNLYTKSHLSCRQWCRLQEIFEETGQMWLRTGQIANRERIQAVQLRHLGMFPKGIEMVPPNERYIPPIQEMMAILQENRQSIQQHVQSYMSSFEKSSKTQSATEVAAQLASNQGMLEAQMRGMFITEPRMHEAIYGRLWEQGMMVARPEVQGFFEGLRKEGIQPESVRPEALEFEIPRRLGGGDKFTSYIEAQTIQGLIPSLEPAAQRIARRKIITAISGDPHLADELVPVQQMKDDWTEQAAKAHALMLFAGISPPQVKALVWPDYLTGLIMAINERLQNELSEIVPDSEDINGIGIALQFVAGKVLPQVAQDPQQKQLVATAKKQIQALSKAVSEFDKSMAEEREENEGQPGQEMSAKDAAEMSKSEGESQKLELESQKSEMAMMQQQEAHAADMKRQDERHQADMALARERAVGETLENRLAEERRRDEMQQQNRLFAEQLKAAEERASAAELATEKAEEQLAILRASAGEKKKTDDRSDET